MKKLLFVNLLILLFICGCTHKEPENNVVLENENKTEEVPQEIKVVDLASTARPYAVVINNTSVAVKVQQGLQQAYMVYSIPVEGGLTRLLAFYKDIADLKIGTIRSARHNFLDFAMEQDAIFVHWGWSHYAKDQIASLNINNINGLSDSAFWRENPENLATEHTGYTNLAKVKDVAVKKGYSLTTTKKVPLNYSYSEVDLAPLANSQPATNIFIPSNASLSSSYEYDAENKVYKRSVNNNPHIDYATKKQYTVKNIIIVKINTKVASDGKYWDLTTTGSGEGQYITNGYAIPIKWTKEKRDSQTIYRDLAGEEIKINDGNTFIELQSTNQQYTIK